jgi:hypothetical protein
MRVSQGLVVAVFVGLSLLAGCDRAQPTSPTGTAGTPPAQAFSAAYLGE